VSASRATLRARFAGRSAATPCGSCGPVLDDVLVAARSGAVGVVTADQADVGDAGSLDRQYAAGPARDSDRSGQRADRLVQRPWTKPAGPGCAGPGVWTRAVDQPGVGPAPVDQAVRGPRIGWSKGWSGRAGPVVRPGPGAWTKPGPARARAGPRSWSSRPRGWTSGPHRGFDLLFDPSPGWSGPRTASASEPASAGPRCLSRVRFPRFAGDLVIWIGPARGGW
jgi:hypothetical protein